MAHRTWLLMAALAAALLVPPAAQAAGKEEIDARVRAAKATLFTEEPLAKELAAKAAGMLVMPRVIKAGFGIGGEGGDGALQVNGSTVAYYRTAGVSFGFQLGGQAKSQVLLFMTEEALNSFQTSEGWEVGVDGSVALVNIGAGADLDSHTLQSSIIGFVFGNKGLMYDLSLEGARYWQIER